MGDFASPPPLRRKTSAELRRVASKLLRRIGLTGVRRLKTMGRAALKSTRASRVAKSKRQRAVAEGDRLQAPDWTPAAAVLFRRIVEARRGKGRRPKNAKVFVRGLLQTFNERSAFGDAALEVAGVGSPELLTMTKILEYHAIVVAKAPSKAAQQALAIVKSAVRVAGSAPLAAAPEVITAPSAGIATGEWAAARVPHPRPRPALSERPRKLISALALERFPIPRHAVVAPERAARRVKTYIAKGGSMPPSAAFVKSLLHAEKLPTAVSSAGDHFVMAASGEWASLAQLLASFAIPTDEPPGSLILRSEEFTERQWSEKVGAAVFPPQMTAALRRATSMIGARVPEAPRYACACAGFDAAFPAFRAMFPGARYVAAWERDKKLRAFLARAYGPDGLEPSRVFAEATDPVSHAAADGADFFLITPPCEVWSKLNPSRTLRARTRAAAELGEMLGYAHAHRPIAVIVENVDVPEFVLAVEGALRSLVGYRVVLCRPRSAEVARERVYALAVRER